MIENTKPDWWRTIPHPTYGYYGGRTKRWVDYPEPKPTPVDWMDDDFRSHDMALHDSNFLTPAERKLARKVADKELGFGLRLGNPKKLPFYGRFYRLLALAVFNSTVKPIASDPFGKPCFGTSVNLTF